MKPSSSLGSVQILRPTGRLDAAGATPFEAELQRRFAQGELRLVIDFAAVRYVSSNGLRVLLRARKEAEARGGALKLAGLSPRLLEIFEMAGFDQVFEIFETVSAALASFG